MTSLRGSAARRCNILSRYRADDDPELIEARREHAVLSIEEYVAKIVASAPPLTELQRSRIAALLAPSPQERAA